MTAMNNMEHKIKKLEKLADVNPRIPGSVVQRVLMPNHGIGWSVAIGELNAPKIIAYAFTLDEAFSQVEKDIREAKRQIRKK